DADAPHTLGLLRSGGERPHSCAAKKRDELAPSHCLPLRLRTRHRGGLNLHTGRGLSRSALGQKRTYAVQNTMSALPPIATWIAFFSMSPLGQKRTWC